MGVMPFISKPNRVQRNESQPMIEFNAEKVSFFTFDFHHCLGQVKMLTTAEEFYELKQKKEFEAVFKELLQYHDSSQSQNSPQLRYIRFTDILILQNIPLQFIKDEKKFADLKSMFQERIINQYPNSVMFELHSVLSVYSTKTRCGCLTSTVSINMPSCDIVLSRFPLHNPSLERVPVRAKLNKYISNIQIQSSLSQSLKLSVINFGNNFCETDVLYIRNHLVTLLFHALYHDLHMILCGIQPAIFDCQSIINAPIMQESNVYPKITKASVQVIKQWTQTEGGLHAFSACPPFVHFTNYDVKHVVQNPCVALSEFVIRKYSRDLDFKLSPNKPIYVEYKWCNNNEEGTTKQYTAPDNSAVSAKAI